MGLTSENDFKQKVIVILVELGIIPKPNKSEDLPDIFYGDNQNDYKEIICNVTEKLKAVTP